ncbi:hypothetical protein DPMN_077405 [Dreissena polymorpha]|uniref:Homeobox domain-containing protein n=1 Tax=Dreissena polymorpha TaxID=45954 RepID=A0A9D3YKV8_DREPO|nr:hypothetical protein DPMN_077405 [Dreissena polymorpha]
MVVVTDSLSGYRRRSYSRIILAHCCEASNLTVSLDSSIVTLAVNLQFVLTSVKIMLPFQRRRRRENRRRRQRTTFTSDQTLKQGLEYARTDYVSRHRRFELAATLQLTESQKKIWFQNRRAKDKKIEKAQIDLTLRKDALTLLRLTQ